MEENIINLNVKMEEIKNENKYLKKQIKNDNDQNKNLKHYINDLELKMKNINENKYILEKKKNTDSGKIEKLTFLDKSLLGNIIPAEDSFIRKISSAKIYNNPKNYLSQKKKFSNLINSKKGQSILDIQNFHFKKKKNKKIQKKNLYKDFIYLCNKDHKVLKLLVFYNSKIGIFNENNRKKPIFHCSLEFLKEFNCSRENNDLFEMIFEKNNVKKSIIIELPNSEDFLEILKTSEFFKNENIKVKNFEIENNTNFYNSSVNLIDFSKKSGFLEIFTANNDKNWKYIYLTLVGNLLIKFTIPEVFFYNEYRKYRRRVTVYKLNDYNVITDINKISIGTENNVFALKIKNEEIDLVFKSENLNEKKRWIQNLNN